MMALMEQMMVCAVVEKGRRQGRVMGFFTSQDLAISRKKSVTCWKAGAVL